STAVILALAGREGLVAHVGDSRAYRIRARHLERLTRDHSVVEALLAAGAINTEQANLHPDANRITRALGIAPEIEPELSAPIHVEAGDVFVLCSDGLSDILNDLDITELVSGSPSPEAACDSLIALANQRGGHDNISVQVLRVLALGPARRAGETVGLAPRSDPPAQRAAQSSPPNTAPSATLDASIGNGRAAEPHTRGSSSDAQTVVAQPGFTVVMGASEGVTKTVHHASEPRQAAPTIVDPLAAGGPPRTLPGDALHAPSPANVHAASRADAPRQPALTAPFEPSAMPPAPPGMPEIRPSVPHAPRDPREGEVRLLLWGTAGACALVVLIVAVWWVIR
ncbi:MAG TPA: hypothetical protein VIM73_21440, partial [Polyangiaceae bacterium]